MGLTHVEDSLKWLFGQLHFCVVFWYFSQCCKPPLIMKFTGTLAVPCRSLSHCRKISEWYKKGSKTFPHFHFQQYSNRIYASLVFPIRQDKLAVHKHNFEENVCLAVSDGDLGCRDGTIEHLKENRGILFKAQTRLFCSPGIFMSLFKPTVKH